MDHQHTGAHRAAQGHGVYNRAVVHKHACMVVEIIFLCLHEWCRLNAPWSVQPQWPVYLEHK
jgi:hypothetical protein